MYKKYESKEKKNVNKKICMYTKIIYVNEDYKCIKKYECKQKLCM